MADFIIKEITSYLADIGVVAVFVSTIGMLISVMKGAFTKGEIKF